MASRTVPHSKLRKRRRRRFALKASLVGCAAALVLCGIVVLLRAPFLRIQTVTVSGANEVSTSALVRLAQKKLGGSYLWLLPKNDILLYPKEKLAAAALAAFPDIRTLSVHASSLSSITFDVSEREPAGAWCGASSASSTPCLLLDSSGVAYQLAPKVTGASSTPWQRYYGPLSGSVSRLPASYLTPAQFKSLEALSKTLAQAAEKDGSGSLLDVSVEQDGAAKLQFSSGFYLLFGLSEDAAKIANNFSIALTSAPFASRQLSDFEYLDLRFGDELYYKLKGSVSSD